MDPPFSFPGAVDLYGEIVTDRHNRVKQVPAKSSLTVQQQEEQPFRNTRARQLLYMGEGE